MPTTRSAWRPPTAHCTERRSSAAVRGARRLDASPHPALNCHVSVPTAPAVTDVAMPAGLAYVTYAATTTDLLYDLTDTPHECMEACLSLPATGCNATDRLRLWRGE